MDRSSYILKDNRYTVKGDLELGFDEIDEDAEVSVCVYLQDIYKNDYWTETIVYED